ncbi:MAG: phosphatase PAP2 family protein [Actinomycetota bacterium]
MATAVAVWGTLAVNYAVKTRVNRPRPELDDAPQAIEPPSTSSFPSSHAAMSAAAALALADATPRARGALRLAALAMAASRVHLGVHHPSDVVAGYLLGSVTGRVSRRLVPLRRRAG